MKKCPICDNTYDDSLRFCQSDGAALIDAPGSGWKPEDGREAHGSTSVEAPSVPESAVERPNVTFGTPPEQATRVEWAQPPAPVAGWEQRGVGQSTPFQPPLTEGANKSLAIWSLVLGVLGFVCCGFFASVPAIIVGSIAKGNINREPHIYGGSGMATAGIVLGVLGTLFSIIVAVAQIAILLADGTEF